MEITSNVVCLKSINFPKFSGKQLYMHKNLNLPEGFEEYKDMIKKMLSMINKFSGDIYITIDEKLVNKNTSHRRGGIHTDGNYIYGWGDGEGWLTGENGRILNKEKHKKQYMSNTGGMLIASTFSACKAYKGKIEGYIAQGGNCQDLTNQLHKCEEINIKENLVYFINSTGLHESLPVPKDIKRSLLRITLPHDFILEKKQ